MRLHGYVFRALFLACCLGVGVFAFILITGNVLKDIAELVAAEQIGAGLVLRLLGLLVPYVISYSLPLGTLIGILLVMGRLSANLELTAMKSAGLSLWRIAAPAFLLLIAGTLLASYINAFHAPAARASYKFLLRESIRNDPLRFIVPRSFIHDFRGYVLYAGEREGDRLRNVWIWELDQEQRAIRLLRAQQATVRFDPERTALILAPERAFVELRDRDNPDDLQRLQPTLSFGSTEFLLPLGQLLGRMDFRVKLSEMRISDMRVRQQELEADGLTYEEWVESRRLSFYASRNLALGYSVLSLGLLGIPLGIRVSRKETYANVVLALLIAFAYYLVLIMIGWLETRPQWRPELLVWLPNLACQALGFYLLDRVNRY